MCFITDHMVAENTCTNVEHLEDGEEPVPQRETSAKKKKHDDLFEDVLVKMQRKYDSVEGGQEDESFFALLHSIFIRFSAEEKDEMQVDILQLVANKLKNKSVN
ncbi:uncharacterized protein LOC118748896 [Rhagoletis pomonella]|uniref:uncharacterized protein LOC118748896 n=1 Tax=Rhagoletis pomonella TaxID=28610 RepID=UPI001780FAAB|nr:uncharacterized protein LOC118748896 [Rhagoletis pomonella]